MRRFDVAVATAMMILVVGTGCETKGREETNDHGTAVAAAAAAATAPAPLERGKYLVTILACNECHTPMVMGPTGPTHDMSRMLSGHPEGMQLTPPPNVAGTPWVLIGAGTGTAFAGPWGTTYSPNLTPDTNTGLGIWTEEMFLNAMKQGKHMGTSREIQPPMPWRWYGQMSDEDLKSIFAYLKSIPPIVNHVPDYAPPVGAGN